MNKYDSPFESFKNQNILVVGDVMLDRYLTGSASRISPEAPVPVVHLQGRENRLGGAANVALNLKALGATPYLCSVAGRDTDASLLQERLQEQGLSSRGIIYSDERITTVKTRIIASNQHLLRLDTEDQHELTAGEAKELLSVVLQLLEQKEVHAILFQDYNKGVLTEQLVRQIILEAIKRDIPTAVDPKLKNFWSYRQVTLFKPNLKEIKAQVPFPLQAEFDALREAAHLIRRKLGNQYTLITLSEKGLFYESEREAAIVPTQPRTIADVCGAGDTVFTIAGLGLSLGMPLEEIALMANLAGGQVCEKVGVVPVDAQQLTKEYTLLKTNGSLA